MPTLDQLSGSKRFSTLDLQSGYWQVTISPEDREKKKMGSGPHNATWIVHCTCNFRVTDERCVQPTARFFS